MSAVGVSCTRQTFTTPVCPELRCTSAALVNCAGKLVVTLVMVVVVEVPETPASDPSRYFAVPVMVPTDVPPRCRMLKLPLSIRFLKFG